MNGPSYTPPSCLPLLCEPRDLPSELDEALTLPFTEEACGSSPLVGGKGSQLGLLSSIQHKVMCQGRLSPLSLSLLIILSNFSSFIQYCGIFHGGAMFSWLTLAQEFTFLRTYIQASVLYLLMKSNLLPTKLCPHKPGNFYSTNIDP